MKIRYRNMKLSFLLVCCLACFSLYGQQHNGGVVTLSGDTVACTIVLNIKDVGLKPRAGEVNRYDYVVAEFSNDSIRKIYPGTIRAYFVRWSEKKPEQISWYVSDSFNVTHDVLISNPKLNLQVFLHRLVIGGHFNLWFFEQPEPGARNDRIFILEEKSTGKRNYFYRTRQLKKLLGAWPGYNKDNPDYADWFTGKQRMVLDYNRYKAGK